ncbi:MAG: ACT domain-containing protein [Elusimicrobiales bacterium]|nr:ACT domain-containing protein [Elusimicrobiales bacterium]
MPAKLIRQYTVFIPNSPGALSKFLAIFQKAGINIVGVASEVRDDSGVVRVAIDQEGQISKVITDAGFTTIESLMISYEFPSDKAGNLYKLTQLMNKHGINITTVYGTSFAGDKGRIIFNVSETEKALQVINSELEKLQ